MESTVEIPYDATVVTGLEKLALKEIEQKVCVSKSRYTCGHVLFTTPARFQDVRKLCSVDNIYVVIYEQETAASFTGATKENLETIMASMVDECNWPMGIDVWKETVERFENADANAILTGGAGGDDKPSFRVSCNRTGTHKFTSQDASCAFGGLINDRFGWKVSLKEFDIEILLTIKNDYIRISLCLTKESLYKRHIVSYGTTTLRGTVAYNLVQIADIQSGDIVCDPLCGTSVIPIECQINWPDTLVLAGDNHNVAIEKSTENLKSNRLTKADLTQWDTMRLPLKSDSIDVFVTDLPFGKRMGSRTENKTLYPSFLLQMARCSRMGSGRIVLLTHDKHNANRTFLDGSIKQYCRLERAHYVKLGGLDSSIYLLKRNFRPFAEN